MNTCPWCGKPSEKQYLHVKDYFLTQEAFDIFECAHCGLLFTVPRPASNEIGKYYQSEAYYSHQENKKGFVPRLYETIKVFNLKKKVKMAIDGLNPGRLLDIGCGVGDFLCQVKQNNWDIMGIEPSDGAKSIAETRLGFRPLDPAASSTLPDASFDVITLWHVLEHIDDLQFQTSEIVRLLKPNGRLIIALPNFQSFDCQYYKEKWAAWDVPRHLNHFSPDTLRSIVVSLGFVPLDTKKLIWDAYYISFLSERYGHHSVPLLRGAWVGLRSNLKARRSGMYSSLVYRFQKTTPHG
jgi:2-polyprenyl-3-methyl-5-hydroxy-6-metoxy-1,4-benzoquinol methylase